MSVSGVGKGKNTDGYFIVVDRGLGNTLVWVQMIFDVIPSLEGLHELACRDDEVRHILLLSVILL